MKITKLFILLTLFVLLFISPNYAQDSTSKTISDIELPDVVLIISGTFSERRVTGKVVGVHDGDTATVLDKDKQQYKFRFNGIDAPELKQDFGNKSKQHLSDLIFGKEVTVIFNKVDKYGRFVGKIMVNGVDAKVKDTDKLGELLKPYSAKEMDSHAVSKSVNIPESNSAELILPMNSL